MGGLYGDGFIALKGAFEPSCIEQLHEDIDILFAEALKQPDGAVGRGPNRYYVEIHPERIGRLIRQVARANQKPCDVSSCRSTRTHRTSPID